MGRWPGAGTFGMAAGRRRLACDPDVLLRGISGPSVCFLSALEEGQAGFRPVFLIRIDVQSQGPKPGVQPAQRVAATACLSPRRRVPRCSVEEEFFQE